MATHKAKPLSGISLNYEVVGGTTAPTTFNKENTIWVNTDVEITGHAFDYTAPDYLTTGGVWIQTDIDKAAVSFNAIKKDELMIYPYVCKQWNGSSWKRMAGALYKNGTSVLDYKSIYQPTIDSSNFTIMSAGHFPTYNFNSNTFYAKSEWYNGGSSEYCVIRTNSIIDLSEYSKISFTVYHSNSTGGGDYNYVICQTYSDANRSTLVSNNYWQQNSSTVNTSTTYTVDVSDRTDKIYLYIGVEQTHSNWNFTFSNIVLE